MACRTYGRGGRPVDERCKDPGRTAQGTANPARAAGPRLSHRPARPRAPPAPSDGTRLCSRCSLAGTCSWPAFSRTSAVRAESAIRAALVASPPLKFLLAFMVVCGLRFVVSFRRTGMTPFATRDLVLRNLRLPGRRGRGVRPHLHTGLLGWYRRIIPVFQVWCPIAVVLSWIPALGFVPVTATSITGSCR
jgi:hypothetical protein